VHKGTFTAFATWRTDAATAVQPRADRIVTTGRSSDEALRAPPRARRFFRRTRRAHGNAQRVCA
jgi:hypothetical protein